MPEGVDSENSNAEFADGVLTIKIAKRTAQISVVPKKIQIWKN